MGAEVNSAVADAGPILHLNEIDCLTLLRIFDALHIPDAVWSETVGQGRVAEADLLRLGTAQRHSLTQKEVTQFVRQNDLQTLHNGERECLYLCQQIDVPTVLTDDLAVREQAKRQNLTPVGSLGIVVKVYRQGQISMSDAERYLVDLYEVSSLFVTRTIVELAIEQLREKFRL